VVAAAGRRWPKSTSRRWSTAPLLKAGVPIELPESRAKALAEEKEQLTVSIDRDGTVFLDNEALSPGELPERLAEVRPGPDGNLPLVTLRAHRALEYGRVIGVMGELNHAGFNSISLVTVAGGAGPVVSAGSGEAE